MTNQKTLEIKIIDSHTGGEPTRIIIDGGPDLGAANLADRIKIFRKDFDHYRKAVVLEPRGSDVMVGALLCKSVNPDCIAGVIFFNNVGYLGMCGHGTIGLAVTLAHLGKINHGKHLIETPVGNVEINLIDDNNVSIDNVPSYRYKKQITINVPQLGPITGDIAWGGNWFFLVSDHGQDLEIANIDQLTTYSWQIRQALNAQGFTGKGNQEIDHVELFGPPSKNSVADSKNFVLCPGKAYDRSPCGTGTSAKLACLYQDGKLKENQIWRQESIVGSIFEGSVKVEDGKIIPTIKGSAYINAESNFILNPNDPFQLGID